MNPLDLYLSRVARELRSMPDWKREEELRELRSHLEQRVEDFEVEGLNPEEAQAKAVVGFGSARMLGAGLCDVWEGVPTSWRGVAAVVLKVSGIGIAIQISCFVLLLVMPALYLSNNPTSLAEPTLLPSFWTALDLLVRLLSLCAQVCCGRLLSLWLGRRGPKVVASLLALLWVVGAPIVAVLDFFAGVQLSTSEEVVLTLLLLLTVELLKWLLWTVLFRFVWQRHWRSLPPGQAPNTNRRNFRSPLWFKARER